MKTFVFTYLFSSFLAIVITPIVIAASHKLGVYDRPNARNIHADAVPRIGGVAIFLSSMLVIMTVWFLDNAIGDRFRSMPVQITVLLCAATFILFVGIVDDMHGLRVRHKLLVQVVAAAMICLAGTRIESLNFANLFTLRFGAASWLITILWIVGITNAVNLTDGLDGLAAGICAITCGAIAVFAAAFGEPVPVVITLALMGSLSGFLFFNFNPAAIFMGDCGSMFLGLMLGAMSVTCAMKSQTMVALSLPALALGLPIIDTAFTILRRYLDRRTITSPDKGHLHHRPLDMGLRHSHVVIIIYAVAALAAGMGLFMLITDGPETISVLLSILILLGLVFRITGSLTIGEILVGLKARHAVTQQVKEETRQFEDVQLYFRNGRTFDQWWLAMCLADDRLGADRLCLEFFAGDSQRQQLSWRRAGADTVAAGSQDMVHATVFSRDSRVGSSL